MAKKEKELQRLKALVDAAIEYELIYTAPEIVYDGFAPLRDIFMRHQEKADEYFEKGKLQELERLFEKLTAKLKSRAELKFANFIAEKSGVEFHPFDGLGDKINHILQKEKIESEDEEDLVRLQLDIYKQTNAESKNTALLNELLNNYFKVAPKKSTTTWSKEIKREKVVDDEIVSLVSGSGPKPLIYESERIKSPDEKRLLDITRQSDDGKSGVTTIHVILTRTSLPIYQLNEFNANIKAFWRDNNTVVIQTPANLMAVVQYNTVQSFNDIINIEYTIE